MFYSVTVSNEQDTSNRSTSNEMGRFKIQSETIEEADMDGDGEVNFEEFVDAVRR